MNDIEPFALVAVLVGVVGLLSVQANRVSERFRVPTPALFFIGAALAVELFPSLNSPDEATVERIVTAALVCILFDGGLTIGRKRFRSAAKPILVVGVVGTFLTAAAVAAVAHVAFGFSWYLSLLLATALAPTDPAVVFSVLGRREIAGRSGTILEGESGVNDPVGIALMVSLLAAGGLDGGAVVDVSLEFVVQMVVGTVVGVVGGAALLRFSRNVSLPSDALYPLRTLTAAVLLYGLATLAHGSGFLAVFVAGIMLGDASAPYKREIERFHSTLASLGEVVAFIVLGLTVDLGTITRLDVWLPGLLLGAVIAFVVRPLIVGPLLLGYGLERNEKTFVLFAGLKGAVPILLGGYVLLEHLPGADRLYGIIVVVVTFSVLAQGTFVPVVARALKLSIRTVEPQPWALGIRLREEPGEMHEFVVAPGSMVEGRTLGELARLPPAVWISFVVRDEVVVEVREDTTLEPGDRVLLVADEDAAAFAAQAFGVPSD